MIFGDVTCNPRIVIFKQNARTGLSKSLKLESTVYHMPIASAGVTDYIKLEQNAFTFNKTTIACVTGGIVSARIVLAEEQRSRVENGKETL